MNRIEIEFEEQGIESLLGPVQPGQRVSAAGLLTLLDEGSEEQLLEALDYLQEQGAVLDTGELPKAYGQSEAAVRLRREEQLVREGRLMTELEDTDPLRLYLEELAAIPACGDMRLLAEELAAANNAGKNPEAVQEKLLSLCLSRVAELAEGATGQGVLLLDLIQEGSMGLWQALTGFTGGDFDAFRDAAIQMALARAVTLQAFADGVGQKLRTAMEDYSSVDDKLLTQLGRNPTLEEIAHEMHILPQEAAIVASMVENARTMVRKAPPAEDPEPQPEDNQAVEDTAYFQMRQRITELLSVLQPEDVKLLTLRFGLENSKPLSPEEVGRRMNLTAEEVVDKEAAALSMLRQQK